MKRGLFIVLEGPDRSGKSTQALRLVAALRARGREVSHTREPGGTSFAEAIRKILLDPAHAVDPTAELLLYEAARAQHTRERIIPALKAGKTVVCERYTLATLAYQGHARRLPLPLVRTLNRIASFGVRPDLTLVLDIPEAQFSRRRAGPPDRLEREGEDFRRRVRRGYRALAKTEPAVALVDADRAPEAVSQDILRRLARVLR